MNKSFTKWIGSSVKKAEGLLFYSDETLKAAKEMGVTPEQYMQRATGGNCKTVTKPAEAHLSPGTTKDIWEKVYQTPGLLITLIVIGSVAATYTIVLSNNLPFPGRYQMSVLNVANGVRLDTWTGRSQVGHLRSVNGSYWWEWEGTESKAR